MELIATLPSSSFRSKEGLSPDNLKHLEQVFREVVGDHEEICVDQFKRIVKSSNKFFVERIFKLFDTDKSGSVSLEEFMTAMRTFSQLSSTQKLHWLFQIYDIDGDGLIQFSELKNVIRACMAENGLQFSDKEVNELTAMLFEDADTDKSGSINFEKFQKQLRRQPGLVENLTMSIENWLLPRKFMEQYPTVKRLAPRKLKWDYIKNNAVSFIFLLAFLIVNIALFISAIVKYKDTNGFVMVARGCGQCLNFTSVFVLVLMLRHAITWLRSHGIAEFLPLDQHIYFHKLTGIFIFVFSIVHTIMHICNFNIAADQTKFTLTEYLFHTSPGIGWVCGSASITGWILLVVLIIMVVAALPFVRRNGNFEIFYYTHLLYVVYWIVLILHGPNFWKWFIGPFALYVIELSIKLYRKLIANRKAYIYKGILLPSKVIQLVIKRPPNFYYKPGDYVYVNMPQIALYEWHPFTISSAPEVEDVICLHIRVVGGWTNELYRYFKEEEKWAVPVHSSTDSTLPDFTGTSHINPSFQEDEDENPDDIKLREKPHKILTTVKSVQLTVDNSAKHFSSKRRHSLPKNLWRSSRRHTRNSVRVSTAGKSFRQCESIIIMPVVEEMAEDPSSVAENGRVALEKKEENLDDNVIVSQCPLKISLDGPYGSPSNHIFEAEHAVLVATGIGVTPFASILQSIMHRHRNSMHSCPRCDHSFNDQSMFTGMRLRKVDFYWINRDQACFEWFVTLLSQLEIEEVKTHNQSERFLDIHMYVTSALMKYDMKALGLQMALDLLHTKEERCLVTGLKTRTQPGRPDWNNVFQDIAIRKKGKVTIFFCGPTILGKTLHQKCNEFNFSFRKEVF